MQTITYKAPLMHCSSCSMLLEGLEDELPGVESVKARLKSQEVVVTFDESRVTEEAIKAAALEEGYELISQTSN